MSTVSELRITLDGSERVVPAGTTAGQALDADGRTMIAARVNGELRDLAGSNTAALLARAGSALEMANFFDFS